MELKSLHLEENDYGSLRSNRTFMELKLSFTYYYARYTNSSNRTFMELKYCSFFSDLLLLNCSNRTFMELKLRKREHKPQIKPF